ncbi:hypothetical protein FOA52_001944 [Chlamydomonas sp. UWO 241]|nr:hypothetical protein FOA52_001944 [Chlamydomonas sp. UWO 241]
MLGWRLADQDGNLSNEGLCVFWACVSMVASLCMYYFGRFYSPLFFKCYKGLTPSEQREWDVRYASMPFGFLCVWYAYIMLMSSDFLFEDGPVPHMHRSNAVTWTQLGIAFGFFVVDFFVCFKYNMGGQEMLWHHIGTLMAVTTSILTGEQHMSSVWMLLTEATTPLINMRWWLDKAGMKSSPVYIYNGLGIFFCWILFRLVSFVPFFYNIWVQRAQLAIVHPMCVFIMYTFPPALTLLNVWWFTKIVKGVMKGLSGGFKVKPTATKAKPE